MLALLYPSQNDSVVFKSKPDYYAITDKSGNFTIKNISPGTYRLFGIKDLNANYKFDKGDEEIGFVAAAVLLPADSNYSIKLFKETDIKPRLVTARKEAQGRVAIGLSAPALQFDFQLLDIKLSKEKLFLFNNRTKDGFTIFYNDTITVSLNAVIKDANVFLMGEEVAQYNGAYKVSQGLLDRFGSARVVDTPISELGFAGLGVGAAMVGLRPVIEMMTWNFAILAMDQIVNNAAKVRHMSGGQLRCRIVVRGASGAGGRLSSQHSQCLESAYVNVPGLKVVASATPADAKGLLKAAIRDDNPVCFFEAELLYNAKGDVPEGEHLLENGKADINRPGKDVTIITYSRMLTWHVPPAAEELAKEGIDVEVVDLRTLRPLDEEAILASVRKTNRAVIVEEAWPHCSVGTDVVDLIQRDAFDDLDAPIGHVTGLDVNMAYAAALETATQPSVERIVKAVHQALYR